MSVSVWQTYSAGPSSSKQPHRHLYLAGDRGGRVGRRLRRGRPRLRLVRRAHVLEVLVAAHPQVRRGAVQEARRHHLSSEAEGVHSKHSRDRER